MRKDLFMLGTKITYLLLVRYPHMAVQIRPADTRHIADLIRTIESQQQCSIALDLSTFITDAIDFVHAGNISVRKVLIPLCLVVRKNHKRRRRLLKH
jgi:hypothetical protein